MTKSCRGRQSAALAAIGQFRTESGHRWKPLPIIPNGTAGRPWRLPGATDPPRQQARQWRIFGRAKSHTGDRGHWEITQTLCALLYRVVRRRQWISLDSVEL